MSQHLQRRGLMELSLNKLSNVYVVCIWMSDPSDIHYDIKLMMELWKQKVLHTFFCKEAEEIVLLLQFVFLFLLVDLIFIIREKKSFSVKKWKPYWLASMGVKTAHFQNGPVSKWPTSKTAQQPKRPYQQRLTFM